MVATPEPTSILDAYAVIKSINRFDYKPSIGLVINKAESIREALDTMDSFARIVEKYTGLSVHKLGYVLNDYQVINAIKAQVPVVVNTPESVSAQNISTLAGRLLEEPPETGDGLKEFFNKLLARK